MTWTTQQRSDAAGGLRWIRRGEGAPVVLIHGVGLRAESWGAQIAALSEQFAVYAIDMPGHGESQGFAHVPVLADYTDAIAAAIATIGAPVAVAGHSMGGIVAMDLAIRHPRLCIGLIAANAIFRRSAEAAAVVRARAAAMPDDAVSDPAPVLQRWFGADQDGEPAQACRRWLTSVDPTGYKKAYTVFAGEDGPPDDGLAGLACPALFYTGGDEPNSTPAMSRAMAELAPKGEARILDGATHMMMMTHIEDVNAAMRDFFLNCHEARP